ncbi:hypothetical protein ECG_03383 [Echinococcus granulosus]|nr:hypothetical protein ECG_03383 [Echinococcus granulosus]
MYFYGDRYSVPYRHLILGLSGYARLQKACRLLSQLTNLWKNGNPVPHLYSVGELLRLQETLFSPKYLLCCGNEEFASGLHFTGDSLGYICPRECVPAALDFKRAPLYQDTD